MASSVLAGAPGDCCFKGFKHTGEPVGKTITIAEVPTYLSEPPTGVPQQADGKKRVILYFADIYGPFYINGQLLQDHFASHGMFTLVS